MKKFLYMFALVFLLVACDDDDSFVSPNSDSPEEQSSSGKSTDGKSSGGKSSSEKSTASSSSSRSSSNRYAEDCKGQPDYVLCDARDGQLYRTFEFGSQVWMAENLNYATEGSRCYENQDSNCVKFGRFYPWEEAMDACPEGWHLPSVKEYNILFDAAGGKDNAGFLLKSDSSWGWDSWHDKSGGGPGIFSFSVLPAGKMMEEKSYNEGHEANLWEDQRYDYGKLNFVHFTRDETYVRQDTQFDDEPYAYSIRCIKGEREVIEPVAPAKEAGTLTDSRDGQVYKTVRIGSQIWMAENLRYDYNEGGARTGCYSDSIENCEKMYYTWSAAMDSAGLFSSDGLGCGRADSCEVTGRVRGVCPEGWHLPDSIDIAELIYSVGGEYSFASVLKATEGWGECDKPEKSGNGIDKYGFAMKPSGYAIFDPGYHSLTERMAYIWTITSSHSNDHVWVMAVSDCGEGGFSIQETTRGAAVPVRCLKEAP